MTLSYDVKKIPKKAKVVTLVNSVQHQLQFMDYYLTWPAIPDNCMWLDLINFGPKSRGQKTKKATENGHF